MSEILNGARSTD